MLLRRFQEADHGADGILCDRDDFPIADVGGVLHFLGAFSGRARAARSALVDDAPALVWAQGGTPRVVFAFTFADGVIAGIDLIADPDRLARFSIKFVATEANEQ